MSNDNENTPLEQSLRELEGPAPAAWERMRRDLAGAAERSGLIDVAFERHDSPLGTIIVGATREGLVRVGLPAEDEDAVLQQLAERVSPRVLHASRDSLTQTRRELDEYFDRSRQVFDDAARLATDGRLPARGAARDGRRSRTARRPRTATSRRAPAAPARRAPQARAGHQPAADRRAVPSRAAHGRRSRRLPGGLEAKAALLHLEGAA